MIAIIVGAGLAACLGTRALIPALRRAAVLDRPNERSSHEVPTPRGGGLAVIAALLAAWLGLIAIGAASTTLLPAIAGAAALAVISWLDDLRGLSPAVRLGAQCAAVAFGIAAMPEGAVFQFWLPPWLDRAAAALVWVWFVNLYNFMDGIDGLAGTETAAIGIGLALFAVIGVGRDRCSPRSPRPSPPPRSGFSRGTGRRRAFFSAMSAACRLVICSAFCCSPPPRAGTG